MLFIKYKLIINMTFTWALLWWHFYTNNVDYEQNDFVLYILWVWKNLLKKKVSCLFFFRKNDALSPEHTLSHSINTELIRLGYIHNSLLFKAVSIIRLARQGFYHSGEGDTVAGGYRKRGWTSDDIIEAVHRNSSPDCPRLSSQPKKNIQIING